MAGSGGSETRRVIVCDVRGLTEPDACTVDALARLQLAARRAGCEIRLAHACGALRGLVRLMGLEETLPLDLEPRRQSEEREEPVGVEEEGDPPDPVS